MVDSFSGYNNCLNVIWLYFDMFKFSIESSILLLSIDFKQHSFIIITFAYFNGFFAFAYPYAYKLQLILFIV